MDDENLKGKINLEFISKIIVYPSQQCPTFDSPKKIGGKQ
jgi:hypothetical protein